MLNQKSELQKALERHKDNIAKKELEHNVASKTPELEKVIADRAKRLQEVAPTEIVRYQLFNNRETVFGQFKKYSRKFFYIFFFPERRRQSPEQRIPSSKGQVARENQLEMRSILNNLYNYVSFITLN